MARKYSSPILLARYPQFIFIFIKQWKYFIIFSIAAVILVWLYQLIARNEVVQTTSYLGGAHAYMPLTTSPTMFVGSILVGLVAGLITGVIGAGGGYVLTPALMSFGVRGILAVGTDQFHMFAKAIMGTTIHKKLANVNFALAAWFVSGSLLGVSLGGSVNRNLFMLNPAASDALISTIYVIVLGILGAYGLADWIRLSRGDSKSPSLQQSTTKFAIWLQSLPMRPRVHFDRNIIPGGRSISVYPVILCGFFVGFVASIMGVGGGFLTFPMFVYGLGVSTFTTVGTDILQIIFTTAYSSIFQYAIYGFIFYSVCIGMLLGSLIGVQIGAMITRVVKGSQIRAFYALTILAGFVNRAFALPQKLVDLGYLSLPRELTIFLQDAGTTIFFGIVGFFSVWVLASFCDCFSALRNYDGEDKNKIIRDPKKFGLGLAGLAMFFIVLAVWLSPIIDGKTGIQMADRVFNEFAKNSANYLPEARSKVAGFMGIPVDYGVTPKNGRELENILRVLSANQFSASPTGDGRVHIVGKLGALASVALTDAENLYFNKADLYQEKYQLTGTEVVSAWWSVFNGLSRRYIQENHAVEADFSKYITTKVLEPAYNFRGIEPRSMSDHASLLSLFLIFYVLYTIWYGFSIMFLFEGFGIGSSQNSPRKEH